MGNTNSSKSAGESKDSKQHLNNKQDYEEITEIDSKESENSFESEYKQSVNEIEAKLESIEDSIKSDKSIGNLVLQFTEILDIEGINISTVDNVIKQMIGEWKYLKTNEEKLIKCVGQDEMNGLKKIRIDYFGLLLKTATVITKICESCKIQQENVNDLLNIINKTINEGNGMLNEVDLVLYNDSLKQLSKWIDESELAKLIKEWENICKRIDETRSRFEKIMEKYKKMKTWKKVIIALGVIAAVGAFLTLVFLTSGAAAAIAAPMAKTVTICGVKMLTCHFVGCSIGFGVGALVTLGGIVYGCTLPSNKTLEKVENVTKMLKDLMKKSLIIQQELSTLENKRGQMEIVRYGLKDQQSVIKLERALIKIQKYLQEYYTQGQDLIKTVNQECEDCQQIINKG